MKNKYLIFSIVIFLSSLAGAISHRAYAMYRYSQEPIEIKPIKRILPFDIEIPRVKKWLIKYLDGMPVFSDRNYYNRRQTDKFNHCFLLAIPRHDTLPTIIKSNQNLKIYRLVPSFPVDIAYSSWLSKWKKEDIKVNIIGGFEDQENVVSKSYNKNDTIILLPSGIKSSTPILILPESLEEFNLEIIQ